MPKIECKLTICYEPGRESNRTSSTFIYINSLEDYLYFEKILGVKNNDLSSTSRKTLNVNLPEDAPQLITLVEAIEERCGFSPNNTGVILPENRGKEYWLKKERTFSKKEINEAEYLALWSFASLADIKDPTYEEFVQEHYVMKKRKNNKYPLGLLGQFQYMCVTTEMKKVLQSKDIIGLNLENKITNSNDLWSFWSDLRTPRCLLPYVDQNSRVIANPNDLSDFLENKFQCRQFLDGGYTPFQFQFESSELKKMGRFDIAMTQERLGSTGLYMRHRVPIISQKFRQILLDLKVKKLEFDPVKLV